MKEVRLLVDDKNLKTVLTLVNNLNVGLIDDVKVIDKDSTSEYKKLDDSMSIEKAYKSPSKSGEENIEEKREKLFIFASLTIVFLSIAATYFEIYNETYVPPFLRVILAAYWLYSLAGIIVSKEGSDYWVSKLYFNVTK